MGILLTFFSFVRSVRGEDAALQAKWTIIMGITIMGILSTFFSFVRSVRGEDAALQAKWTIIMRITWESYQLSFLLLEV